MRRFEGLLIGPDPSQGVFRDNLFLHADLDFAVRFPRGWQTLNTPQAVMAKPEDGNAVIGLLALPQKEGNDPRAAARAAVAQAQQQSLPAEEAGSVRVGSLTGYRMRALVGQTKLVERTYFSYGGGLYAFHAEAPQNEFAAWEDAFDKAIASFRPLDDDDRPLITERRLALVAAKSGETLEQVSKRSANTWSAAETALANGLTGSERLQAGFLVKIAREQVYAGQRPASSGS